MSRCGKNAQGDRQIETAGFFWEVGRCEVDSNFLGGKVEAALDDGGTHTVAAFFNFSIGQTDDIEMWQAVGKVGFHFDQRRIHAA